MLVRVLGNIVFVPRNFTHAVNSEPIPINEGKIFIENHTTYICIGGDNPWRDRETTKVGPKIADECTRLSITINCNSVDVTIKNNNCPRRCCGWVEKGIANKGGTLSVHGEPFLIFVQGCTHVL
jgi:hypothetical protein